MLRSILLALAVLVLASGCRDTPPEMTPAHPALAAALDAVDEDTNILVVSFDALRADALGVYGSDRGASPNIDRWASDAFVFERFYAAAQATPTSFAGAFTGQYPFRVFRGWRLADVDTLAEAMQRTGRRTFAVLNNVQLVSERNFQQGFDAYEVLRSAPEAEVVSRTAAMLDAGDEEPFFGWVHFISPHSPYTPREMARDFYTPGYEGPYEKGTGPDPHPETEADARRLRELYDGEVFFADMLFGRVMDLLDERGLSGDTLVVLTADHGDQFGEKGGYQHKVVYEMVVRIPFLMRPPGGLADQVRVSRPQVNTDLLPTLAAATGQRAETVDGVDMAGPVTAQRLIVITAMTNRDHRSMAALQDDDKLVVTCPPPEFSEELYDLSVDPHERHDRILDDPDRAGELFDGLTALIGGDPCDVIRDATAGAEITDNLDEETIEKLRSLGYIQ
ncbi:MAG: sulfatase [Wenzhouxiangellaceae bacterium]|nr:sulfatase [Wenzhouxiangellaceae bacterium]